MEKKLRKKRKKLAIAKKDKNYDDILSWRVRLSEDYKSAGREDDSIDELKELLVDLAEDKNKIRVGQAHRQLGEALFMTSSYKEAVIHFQKYLSLAKAEGCVIEQQRAHASLGRMYLFEAENAEVEIEKNEAIGFAYRYNFKGISYVTKLVADNKIPVNEAATLKSRLNINIALSFEIEGRNKDAENYAEAALTLVRENNCAPYDVIQCLQILASVKSKAGSSSEGLVLICEALKLAEGISGDGSKEILCEVLEAKADLHLIVGDFDLAKRCLCEAYKLNVKDGREQLVIQLKKVVFVLNTLEEVRVIDESEYLQRKNMFEQLGDCVVSLKSFSKAVIYYKNMFEYCELLGDSPKNRSAALVSIAESYADMRMFNDALKYFEIEKGLWAHDPKEEFRSRLNLASIYEKKGDPENQLEQLNNARSLAQLAENPIMETEVLVLLQNYHKANTEKSQNLEGILNNLEDEITDLKLQGNSQSDGGSRNEGGSQPMDTDEETYEKIDLSTLIPELQNDDIGEGRSRPKRNMKLAKNDKGESELHVACINRNLKTVQFLVKNGHPVTVYSHIGWAPIHEAANFGFVEGVLFLLDHGADINEQGKLSAMECQGITPLIDSCTNGHLTVIELLLDRGAKVELKTTKPPKYNALTALDNWYKISKDNLSEEESERYENIRKIMIELLKKVGENVDSSSTTYQPEFVVGSDDESQRTLPNRRLQEIRRLATQTSDSDSDDSQMRRRKGTQKLLYSDDDESQTRRRSSVASDNDHEAGPSTSTGRHTGGTSSSSEYRNAPKRRRSPDLSRPQSVSRVKRTKRRGGLNTSSSSSRSSSPEPSLSQHPSSPEVVREVTPSRWLDSEYSDESDNEYNSSDGEIAYIPETMPLKRYRFVKKCPQKRKRKLLSPRNVSPKKAQEENISIRVKVDGKLFLVPINSRELTFKDLAEKVADQYLKMEGMEPRLTLTTTDGAFLSHKDTVGLVLKPNDFNAELCAIIDSLKLPPLTKRYKEACKVENIEEDEYIWRCLEESQATMEITFKNLPIGSQFPLIIKSILKETSLQTLDFSGCSMEDDGIKQLSRVLKNLENLKRLDLSCNYITSDGLRELSIQVGNENSLQSLRHLNLSHNSLGAEGLMAVSELLENLNLTSLNLSNCDLSLLENDPSMISTLNMESLEELDVSYNPLGYKGVSHLFVRLNAWKLKTLNLAYTSLGSEDYDDPNSVAKEVALLFQKIVTKEDEGGILQELNFSGCNLKDDDIRKMLSAAGECGVKIEHLKISCNPELSSQSLNTLAIHTPGILKLTATGCPEFYKEHVKLIDNFQELCLTTAHQIPISEEKLHLKGPVGFIMIKSIS